MRSQIRKIAYAAQVRLPTLRISRSSATDAPKHVLSEWEAGRPEARPVYSSKSYRIVRPFLERLLRRSPLPTVQNPVASKLCAHYIRISCREHTPAEEKRKNVIPPFQQVAWSFLTIAFTLSGAPCVFHTPPAQRRHSSISRSSRPAARHMTQPPPQWISPTPHKSWCLLGEGTWRQDNEHLRHERNINIQLGQFGKEGRRDGGPRRRAGEDRDGKRRKKNGMRILCVIILKTVRGDIRFNEIFLRACAYLKCDVITVPNISLADAIVDGLYARQ